MSFSLLINSDNIDSDFRKYAQEFINIYYSGMVSTGLSKLLYLFSPDVKCTFNNEEIIGEYNLLVKMLENNISRVSYVKLTGSSQPVSTNKVLLNVTGIWQGITFQNQYTESKGFSETFILEKASDKIYVINHMFRFI